MEQQPDLPMGDVADCERGQHAKLLLSLPRDTGLSVVVDAYCPRCGRVVEWISTSKSPWKS